MKLSAFENLVIAGPLWHDAAPSITSLADVGVGVGVGLMFYLAYRALARKRFIENLAPSTCAGVTVGICRLRGRARAGDGHTLLKAPGSDSQVVYWSERVEEQVAVVEEQPPSRRRRHRRVRYEWQEVARRASRAPFWLEDQTGRIGVDPGGASMDTRVDFQEVIEAGGPLGRRRSRARRRGGRTGLRRREVRVIYPGEEVSIIGPARITETGESLRIGPGHWREPEYVITTRGEAKVASAYGRWALFLALLGLALAGFWWAGWTAPGAPGGFAIGFIMAEAPAPRWLLGLLAIACAGVLCRKRFPDSLFAPLPHAREETSHRQERRR